MIHASHSLPRSKPWEQRIADDLAGELELYTGDKRSTIDEMRRFLAVKACRELLTQFEAETTGKEGYEALNDVARVMRSYSLERPALSAAAFRTPLTDTPEWREAMGEIRTFLFGVLAECGLHGSLPEQALRILWSLARGFVIHELTDPFLDPTSYDESYEYALLVFMSGLSSLTKTREAEPTPFSAAFMGG